MRNSLFSLALFLGLTGKTIAAITWHHDVNNSKLFATAEDACKYTLEFPVFVGWRDGSVIGFLAAIPGPGPYYLWCNGNTDRGGTYTYLGVVGEQCPGEKIWRNNVCLTPKDVLAEPSMCPKSGQPIFPTTGTKQEPVSTEIKLGGVHFGFNYDSSRAPRGGINAALDGEITSYGDLGKLWSSSVHKQLAISGSSIQALRGNGRVVSFEGGGQIWTPSQSTQDGLSLFSGNYVYRDQGAQALEIYDNGAAVANLGQLQSITQANGMKLVASNSNASTTSGLAPASGYMLSLTDPFGRSVGFTYNELPPGGNGTVVIKQITDTTGRIIIPGYDQVTGNLTSLTWQDGDVKTFVYEDSKHPWALTGVIDENNKRYATFAYDPNGWAKSTQLSGGVFAYQASYTSAPKPVIREVVDTTNNVLWRYHEWSEPVGASVSQPNGISVGMRFKTVAGTGTGASQAKLLRFAGYDQPAGSGCAASTSNQEFDDRGNVLWHDDFNGHRTCYANNQIRNLEEVQVEGLTGQTGVNASATPTDCSTVTSSNASLPTGSRKISTAWHPDWAIKTKQAEPLKLTTWVYNGQPDPFNGNQLLYCVTPNYGATFPDNRPKLPDGKDIVVLCKQVEQPTLDANGSQGLSAALNTAQPSRTQRYTYTQYGQVLTSTDARNNTTSYEYYQDPTPVFTGTAPNEVGHYQGDLYKVTNAKGHVTTYTSYDRAGKPLSVTDPNGLVTNYAYWPRGWIKSVQVGNQTTGYTYWPTGLLKQVKNPDGSTLDYVYDDAHRLTDVTDNQGNTVHYTLDNAGNRKVEDVKDSTTALTRQIERAYDDLNRLKSVIGAAQ